MRSSLLAILTLIAAPLSAQEPSWWESRGILNGNPESNYSPANIGQLKHVATQTLLQYDSHAIRGMSPEMEQLLWGTSGWITQPGTRNYGVANIGQAKNLADPLYEDFGMERPWTSDLADDDNYAPLNIGQLKNIFSLDPYGRPELPGHPIIVEVSAGSAMQDPEGVACDWIEILNPTSQAINLGSYYLSTRGMFNPKNEQSTEPVRRTSSGSSSIVRWRSNYWEFPNRQLAPMERVIIWGKQVVIPDPLPEVPEEPAQPADDHGSDSLNNIHTNFSLSKQGEYLGLFYRPDPTAPEIQRVQHFFPCLPRMVKDRTFGLTEDFAPDGTFQGKTGLFRNATFGTPNPAHDDDPNNNVIGQPKFSVPPGIQTSSLVTVEIIPINPADDIYFTLDGSEPQKMETSEFDNTSWEYTGSLTLERVGDNQVEVRMGGNIIKTLKRAPTIRAVARRAKAYSKTLNGTFIFPDLVAHQVRPDETFPLESAASNVDVFQKNLLIDPHAIYQNNGPDLPGVLDTDGDGIGEIPYSVDPRFEGSTYHVERRTGTDKQDVDGFDVDVEAALIKSFSTIPSISIVVPPEFLFDHDQINGEGDHDALFENYNYGSNVQGARCGFQWYDPVNPDNILSTDARVEVTGDSSSRWDVTAKKSMRVSFRDHADGGVRHAFHENDEKARLVSSLVIKSPTHDSWTVWERDSSSWKAHRDRAQFITNVFISETLREMAQEDSTPERIAQPQMRPTHVFLNGLYWGVYWTRERAGDSYVAREESVTAWECFTLSDEMLNLPEEIFNQKQFVDYMMLCNWMAVGDWDAFGQNYRISGRLDRTTTLAEFSNIHLFASGLEWDAMDTKEFDFVGGPHGGDRLAHPARIFPRVAIDGVGVNAVIKPWFKDLFESQYKLHTTEGSIKALSPEKVHARFSRIFDDFYRVAINESVRWGGTYGDNAKRSHFTSAESAYGLLDLSGFEDGNGEYVQGVYEFMKEFLSKRPQIVYDQWTTDDNQDRNVIDDSQTSYPFFDADDNDLYKAIWDYAPPRWVNGDWVLHSESAN